MKKPYDLEARVVGTGINLFLVLSLIYCVIMSILSPLSVPLLLFSSD